MRYGSVCSGIEAATVAWHPLGWTPAFFSEIDNFPRAVLAHHYPDVPLHGDFTTIQEHDYDPIDLLVGGTPCQDFSVAGKRAGLDGERGSLTLEYARLARRLGVNWFLWENVLGALSSNKGHDFGAVLACFAGYSQNHQFAVPEGGWRNSGIVPPASPDGHGLAWRVLDAQYFGVPQRRRRLFVVGYIGDWRPAAAVLFERESLLRDITPRRKTRKVAAPDVAACLDASFARLQGASGQDLNHGHSHLVAFGGNNQSGSIDIATAINAHGSPHGRLDFESETFIVPIQEVGKRTGKSTGDPRAGVGIGAIGDLMFTLQACAQHGVAIPIQDKATRYKGGGDGRNDDGSANGFGIGEPGDPYPTIGAHDIHSCFTGSAVRRITPRECERLQGFPDDYTLIPYPPAARRKLELDYLKYLMRGGWKSEEDCYGLAADGNRYKALGNSMAVPVMRWIGERIAMVEHTLHDKAA